MIVLTVAWGRPQARAPPPRPTVEARAVGDEHGLHPVAGAELGQHPAHVRLHRGLGEHELGGDLQIRGALRHEHQHLALARGQRRHGRLLLLALRAADLVRAQARGHVRQEPARRGRGDHGVAPVHGADRGEQLLGRGVLEQEAAGARLDRVERVLVQVEGGQHHDARGVRPAQQGAGGLDAVHLRHAHVHQHDVGARHGHRRHRLAPAPRLRHDRQVRLRVHEHGQPGADQRLVVHQGHADGDGLVGAHGVILSSRAG